MDIKNLYNWIIIIIFAIVLGQSLITHKRYNTLQENYNELLFKQSNIIDSLESENLKKEKSIIDLELSVSDLNNKLDSLYNNKSNIIQEKNRFTISSSISEGSNLLKKNLNENVINNTF